jgi:hypothetical protein
MRIAVQNGSSYAMRTLDLYQAAEFLHVSPRILRGRAASGEVPGAKPGKCWVFIEDDLVCYLREQYASARHMPRRGSKEIGAWSIDAEQYGGSGLADPTASEYESLLGLKISAPRKNSTTG